ncbi:MAG: nonstructural protein [Microviridae sp.]|nr:MAG: nonstructural protein [Microviridae sp.]
MIFKIFSVYDQKAECYLPPFYLPNRNVAVRTFQDSVNNPSHAFNHHPGDYVLVELGEFDDNSASFDIYPALKSLGTAFEYITKEGQPHESQ